MMRKGEEELNSSGFEDDDDDDDEEFDRWSDDDDDDDDDLDDDEVDTNENLFYREGGVVYATGYNYYGELGLGHCQDSLHFQRVPLLQKIVAVAVGEHHSVAVSVRGEVYTWGRNGHGQLGLGDVNHRFQPCRVTALENINITQASCGSLHTLFLSGMEREG
jgi:alpha-tubulin suppressor-like RCC1 family protein